MTGRFEWEEIENEYFNSHAHVERDTVTIDEDVTEDISTHTLTWSVTFGDNNANISNGYISTHTLTWSVTFLLARRISFGAFQLTRSRGA